jgi:hypothetical protein
VADPTHGAGTLRPTTRPAGSVCSIPRTKGRKYQPLWNAAFKEIAAFKRVVPSDLGLQRAAARERAKDNVFAFLIAEDNIGQLAAARKRARESLEEHYVPKYGNYQITAARGRHDLPKDSIDHLRQLREAAARKRASESIEEHCVPKYGNDERGGAARKRAKYSRTIEYFVPKDGIDREVITQDICRYLGDDALVRPGNYEVSIPSTSEIAIMLMSFFRTLRRAKSSEDTLSQLVAILQQ